jgi:LacI family transcriptional regulator
MLRNGRDPAAGGTRAARVTITDVADRLGLSKGTVSRALNGYPDIAESTRTRVARAAQRMGYAPLAHAQAIRTGRVRAIGLVLQIGEHDAQRPFLADFLAGVTSAASDAAWTLTVATATTDADTLATMERLLDERKADGFILPRTRWRDPRIEMLRAAGAPFVLWGRTGASEGCAWFDILGEDAMADAVRRLHAAGHRRIGHLAGGAGYTYGRLRREGFLRAMAELLPAVGHGPANAPSNAPVSAPTVTRKDGRREAARLLAADDPPTALVCATDTAALGAYDAAAALGLTVGRDLSIIGYDGIPEGAHAAPPLTSFEVDSREAGARLARLLIRRIRGEAPEALRETARARLRVRASDGPPAMTPEEIRARVARAQRQL